MVCMNDLNVLVKVKPQFNLMNASQITVRLGCWGKFAYGRSWSLETSMGYPFTLYLFFR